VLHPLVVGACLALLLVLGVCERIARDRAHRAVPIRIHVNGTRGKSTVTRLIWAALREAGVPTLAKTTGTAARVLLPDGSERPVRRLAPPSIREQLWLLRAARRAGARAVVAECMAIQPELQWVSERKMVSATIGVITNIRTDHTDAMGSTLGEIASSLANTTPDGGVLVLGDGAFLAMFQQRAASLGTRVVTVEINNGNGRDLSDWERANEGVALAVTRQLGIPDDVAVAGMRKARPDPGALRAGTMPIGGREIRVVDATAANDPESFELLIAGAGANDSSAHDMPVALRPAEWVAVYHHREDRPLRLRDFAESSPFVRNACRLVVTGDRPGVMLSRFVRARRGGDPVEFLAPKRLADGLARILETRPGVSGVVFCGNTKGFDIRCARG
jgi:gamma-polyglutamate synthase